MVNALLTEIDGVEGQDGVVLVAACNDPARLDPALVRAGRLDRHIRVHMPDRRALASILRACQESTACSERLIGRIV